MVKIKQAFGHYFTKGYFKKSKHTAQRLIYSSQFDLHKNSKTTWSELDLFLKQFNLNDDLLKLQRLYVRDLDHEYPFKESSTTIGSSISSTILNS